MRCHICPAVGDEDHNEKVHEVHRRLWQEYADNPKAFVRDDRGRFSAGTPGNGRNKALALRVLAGLDDELNTEAVNQ